MIHQVAAGEFPTPGLAGLLLSTELEPGYHLTDREVEVLKLLAEGMTNQEIARGLRISQKTVADHLEAIRTKMHVGNRTEVMIKASRDGLIDGFSWNRSCACGAPRRRARGMAPRQAKPRRRDYPWWRSAVPFIINSSGE